MTCFTYIVAFWKSSGTCDFYFEMEILTNQLAWVINKNIIFWFENFALGCARPNLHL